METPPPRAWLVSLVLAAGVARVAYARRTLTADGAVAATLVGGVVFARGGLGAAAALLAFFVSSSALSRWRAGAKQQGLQVKGGRRDAWQVLANGGWPAVWVGLGGQRGLGGCVGGLAAAAADTWGTELGTLVRRPPRLITTLRTVAPGTSGGVTLEGSLAGLGGACLVGLAGLVARPRVGRPGSRLARLRAAVLAGVIGSLADSLLGATVQAGYWCDGCERPTEQPRHARCGRPTRLVRGLRWVDNDVVNASATLVGSLVGAGLERRVGSPVG